MANKSLQKLTTKKGLIKVQSYRGVTLYFVPDHIDHPDLRSGDLTYGLCAVKHNGLICEGYYTQRDIRNAVDGYLLHIGD